MRRVHPMIRQLELRRLLLDLSQQDVARYVGVSVTSVDNWERGKNHPRFEYVERYAQLVGCKLGITEVRGGGRNGE